MAAQLPALSICSNSFSISMPGQGGCRASSLLLLPLGPLPPSASLGRRRALQPQARRTPRLAPLPPPSTPLLLHVNPATGSTHSARRGPRPRRDTANQRSRMSASTSAGRSPGEVLREAASALGPGRPGSGGARAPVAWQPGGPALGAWAPEGRSALGVGAAAKRLWQSAGPSRHASAPA